MVRISRQKQEKLEIIMNLVEELGVDRVLHRLRQTKMMSKEVLDDMKEWETDYEKRVALLGFLVAPEGKRAFGALYELAKVHEEQIKLQEEQEKLRQEQMAQNQTEPKRTPGAGGNKADRSQNSNMKNKLRAQLTKKRGQQTAHAQVGQSGAVTGKKTKSKKDEDKDDPLLEEAARTLEEAERQVKEKKRIDAFRSQLAASEVNDTTSAASGRRSAGSPRTTPTPTTGDSPKVVRPTTEVGETKNSPKNAEPHPPKTVAARVRTESTSSEVRVPVKGIPLAPIPKALNDFSRHKEEQPDGEWGRVPDVEEEEDQDEDETQPPEAANESEGNKTEEATEKAGKVEISEATLTNEEIKTEIPTSGEKSGLSEDLKMAFDVTTAVSSLSDHVIAEIVADWRRLREDRDKGEKWEEERRSEMKLLEEEKEQMRKEKDRFVFKEFELQQKLQELTTKHRSLREDHETLRQGNIQIQQSTKKSNRLHQEMKRKIAKLESKIKSMDKVTVRRGTQTEDKFDKDVYEALRIAEESLSVNQSELNTSLAKLKASQQEIDELKKQVNLKGREINKRERKSKKDEENIRLVSRERDALESKLRKVSEQMEYYRGIMETKTKGNTKRPPPEKKEIKVQRCASGRHVIIKSVASSSGHVSAGDVDDTSRPTSRQTRPTTVKSPSKVKTSTSAPSVASVASTDKPPQTPTKKSTAPSNGSKQTQNEGSKIQTNGGQAGHVEQGTKSQNSTPRTNSSQQGKSPLKPSTQSSTQSTPTPKPRPQGKPLETGDSPRPSITSGEGSTPRKGVDVVSIPSLSLHKK